MLLEEERKKTAKTKYSCGNEEIELPDLEGQNGTTKTNNGMGDNEKPSTTRKRNTTQNPKENDTMDLTESPRKNEAWSKHYNQERETAQKNASAFCGGG